MLPAPFTGDSMPIDVDTEKELGELFASLDLERV